MPIRPPKELFDIKGLLMRAFHSTSDKRAGAAFATFLERDLIPVLTETAPIDTVFIWDGGYVHRKALFPGYKSHREAKAKEEKTPEQVEEGRELDALYKLAKQFFMAIGAVQVRVDNVEADDVIAYISHSVTCLIHTLDQDLLQLNDGDRVAVMVEPGKMSEVPFHLIALHKSLVGDASDGYPGVKGIGPKAWDKLVEAYGYDGMTELDKIVRARNFADLEVVVKESQDKVLDKLWDQRTDWVIQYKLATLHPEWCHATQRRKLIAPVWVKRLPSEARVRALLDTFGADDLYRHFEPFMPTQMMVTLDNWEEFVAHLTATEFGQGMVGMDYESTDVNQFECFKTVMEGKGREYVDVLSQRITGCGLTWGDNFQHTAYLCVDHWDTNNISPGHLKQVLARVPHDQMIVHNAAFEETVTAVNFPEWGWHPENLVVSPVDTQILASYVNENEPTALKHSSKLYLNYKQATYAETLEAAGVETMRDMTGEQAFSYGADDPICTTHLWVLWDLICQCEDTAVNLPDEFLTTSSNVVSFLKGDRIDLKALYRMRDEDQIELDRMWPLLREILRANCYEQNDEATAAYMDVIRESEVALMKDKDLSDEEIRQKLAEKAEKFRSGTVYAPYERHEKAKEWLPTVAGIRNAIVWATGGQAATDPARVVWDDQSISLPASASKMRICNWVYDTIHAEHIFKTEKLRKFLELLSAAAHQFKDREGAEWDALQIYVRDVLSDGALELVSYSGTELNLGSWPQMHILLFGMLGLPVRHFSKNQEGSNRLRLGLQGNPSSGAKAIEMAMAEDCQEGSWRREVLELVRDITTINTRFSLYWVPYPLWIRPDTGRIHGQIKNCGTVTRRPSGTSPNKLQVAKGPVRQVYEADDDRVLVCFDFSSEELRIMASESRDPTLLGAYLSEPEMDVHSLTAASVAPPIIRRMFPDLAQFMKIDPKTRGMDYWQFQEWLHGDDKAMVEAAKFLRNKRAKAINFGYLYSMGPSSLSTTLLVPMEQAKEMLDSMVRTYPGVEDFKDKRSKDAARWGYVTTAYGNRRHATPDILSRDGGARGRMERQVGNAVIQGCLQAGSRVHTDQGLIPIEELVGKAVTVWTGACWASAMGVNRGKCELAEVELESGLTVYCDTRHKLKDDTLKWKKLSDILPGDNVALPKLSQVAFTPSEYVVGWPFLLGFWAGDGFLCVARAKTKGGYREKSWGIVVGEKKLSILHALYDFLVDQGFSPKIRAVDPVYPKTEVVSTLSIGRKKEVERLLSLGCMLGGSKLRVVPDSVFRMSEEDRRQYLYGYALSDGSRTDRSVRWHTPNYLLLTQVQILLSSVGVSSAISKGKAAWRLGTSLTGHALWQQYPQKLLAKHMKGLSIKTGGGDHSRTVDRRVHVNGLTCSQAVAERMYMRYRPDIEEVYRYSRVKAVRKLQVKGVTYTMSVDHPLHQFVADGVIHKNTAADILKNVTATFIRTGMATRYNAHIAGSVYDELVCSVPTRNLVPFCQELKPLMDVTPPGHAVPMVAEGSVGPNWYHQVEFGRDVSEDAIEQALSKAIEWSEEK